jgi:hypothetical protein
VKNMLMSRKSIITLYGLVLSLGMSASAFGLQYAYPQTEEATPSNNYTAVGAATNVLAVDDGATKNDTDYTTTTTLNDAIEFNLTDTVTDPGDDTGHIVRARVWSDKPGTPVTLALYQGTTPIRSDALLTSALGLSGSDADGRDVDDRVVRVEQQQGVQELVEEAADAARAVPHAQGSHVQSLPNQTRFQMHCLVDAFAVGGDRCRQVHRVHDGDGAVPSEFLP